MLNDKTVRAFLYSANVYVPLDDDCNTNENCQDYDFKSYYNYQSLLIHTTVSSKALLDVINTTGVQLITWTRIKVVSYICSVTIQL